jgi:hypothetical protein
MDSYCTMKATHVDEAVAILRTMFIFNLLVTSSYMNVAKKVSPC